jgi:uncharacterized Fe-S center protein
MTKSDVYFAKLPIAQGPSRLDILKQLIKKAGMDKIDFNNKYVAIKMHFGEPGNLSFLRANYVKVLADEIKSLGGKPFITDCNTLYVGGRKNALDHLDSANLNGFNLYTTGCQTIIADGLKGSDEVLVPVKNGKHFETAAIGRAIMDADIIISLTHFKGHESTGFGGALKNIGMGCGSRAGKMQMHASGKPIITEEDCIGCGSCLKICAHAAPTKLENKKYRINNDKCVGCGRCIAVCPQNAIKPRWDAANDDLNEKIAEYTSAVIEGRPNFHISLVIDVSPDCDCHGENGLAIVPDVGFLASFDPIALDQACADLVNKAPSVPTSSIGVNCSTHSDDKFHMAHPSTRWEASVSYGEKIGLGSRDYNLIATN